MRLFNFFLTIVVLSSGTACQETNTISKHKTIKKSAKAYFNNWYYDYKGPTTDFRRFYYKNKDAIVETLEISDVKKLKDKDYALGFIRFSVGTDMIRKAMWFHQIDGNWYKTRYNTVEHEPSFVGLEKKTERFKKLLEEKKKWESNNPEKWWIEYL